MTEALNERLKALNLELRDADGAQRIEALDHLAQTVRQLDMKRAPVPAWARHRLSAAEEDLVEDRFDNMPI